MVCSDFINRIHRSMKFKLNIYGRALFIYLFMISKGNVSLSIFHLDDFIL